MWWTGGGSFSHTPAVLGTKTGRLQLTAEVVCIDTDTLHMGTPGPRTWPGWTGSCVRSMHGWALEADWWHSPAVDYPVTPVGRNRTPP